MVARSENKPRTTVERISDASDRLDEVSRAQSRGAPALRDAANNVLQMDPNSPYPVLSPLGIDSAVGFTANGSVAITSSDSSEGRDLTARAITASGKLTAGSVTAGGEIHGGRITATGQVQADNVGTNFLGVGTVNAAAVNIGRVHLDDNGVQTPGVNAGGTVGCQTVECRGLVTANDVGTNHVGAGQGDFGNLSYHTLVGPPNSRTELKHDRRALPGLFDAVSAVTWHAWRYLPEIDPTQRDQVGPMVDELAGHDVFEPVIVRDEYGDPQTVHLGALVGVLGGALAEAHDVIDDQARKIADLGKRIERLENVT